MTIKVLIVDDHEIVRTGLTALLNGIADFSVVGEASSALEAIAKTNLLQPDVIIMDIRMPGKNGIEACREIKCSHLETKILMLTSHSDREAVIGSIIAGASGYVLKEIGSQALIEAIKHVNNGRSLLDPDVTRQVFEDIIGRNIDSVGVVKAPDCLTQQEENILTLISLGKTNKEIAKEVFLSENTVRNYISVILAKLKLVNRSQAATYATKYITKRKE